MSDRGWKFLGLTALLMASCSILLSVVLFTKLSDEGRDRRSQACLSSEDQQRKAIVGLYRTYHYLEGLSPREKASRLNQAIIEGLPQAEANARVNVPKYCDEKGIGLPEPSHAPIPERPSGL